MKKYLIVALLASLLAGCAHDSPCVPVYDSQGRLVHTNTCMKGTTEVLWSNLNGHFDRVFSPRQGT
ncbi:hypothetical protein [Klebsiella pneumoniae]|uniref:hypothetical protein n=1 Tax=Klebsiella pneumoniae TaxID=573 RepID=UPI0038620F76